jgi:hypothetical protein
MDYEQYPVIGGNPPMVTVLRERSLRHFVTFIPIEPILGIELGTTSNVIEGVSDESRIMDVSDYRCTSTLE